MIFIKILSALTVFALCVSSAKHRSRKNKRNQNAEIEELRIFSEGLLQDDVNNAAKYILVNYQGSTTSTSDNDAAPQP